MAKDTENTEEGTEEDPRADAKGLIKEAVAEALDAFAKKNKPAPRKTDPGNEGPRQNTTWDFLFGRMG